MSTENLNNQEAIDKLKELVNKIKIGMLCTHDPGRKPIHAVPMSVQEVDEAGNIWFLLSSESDSFHYLQAKPMACLLFSDPGSYSFLSIHADSEVSRDKDRIEKYWSPMVAGWFVKGKEDPRIRVLKIKPLEAHYWDSETNKLVNFFKVAISGMTGSKLDVGREGDLNL